MAVSQTAIRAIGKKRFEVVVLRCFGLAHLFDPDSALASWRGAILEGVKIPRRLAAKSCRAFGNPPLPWRVYFA